MPKASKETGLTRRGRWAGRYEELGGSTVGFESFREDADTTALFKGFRDDRCQSPHWGYIVRGKVTSCYADRHEVYETGDAYHAPPGHIPPIWPGSAWTAPSPACTATTTSRTPPSARSRSATAWARGARGFVTDIEAPSETMDTPAYESFARLGFRRPYVRTHFARLS